MLPSPEKVAEALELMAETMVVLRAKLVVVGDDSSASREGERESGLLCFVERERRNETTAERPNEDLYFCNVSLVFSMSALLFFVFKTAQNP